MNKLQREKKMLRLISISNLSVKVYFLKMKLLEVSLRLSFGYTFDLKFLKDLQTMVIELRDTCIIRVFNFFIFQADL